jgi:hypothetical protein
MRKSWPDAASWLHSDTHPQGSCITQLHNALPPAWLTLLLALDALSHIFHCSQQPAALTAGFLLFLSSMFSD